MPPTLKCPSIPSSVSICTKSHYRTAQSRAFSATSRHDAYSRVTRARAQLWRWLGGQGATFRNPADGHTNYLSAYTAEGRLKRVVEAGNKKPDDSANKKANGGEEGRKDAAKIPAETLRDLRPFPLNPSFVSQPVLSDEMKEKIWEAIMVEGFSVRDASTEFGVEMSRIGAVVRLKEIEKEWTRIGKPLAKPYARAIMGMLPVTQFEPDKEKRLRKGWQPHESINDLPIHPATGPQIFHPISESRVFTRADAAKVFDDSLLPADDRVPHPELTLMHKDSKAGMTAAEVSKRQAERDAEAEVKRLRREKKKRGGPVKAIDTRRWEFRFTDINVDNAGKDGRGPHGVGWRYGRPLMDRKRSQVKIPTRVE